MAQSLLSTGPSEAQAALVFAHGAGASEHSPFMEAVAGGLNSRGWLVHRFAFPYMRCAQEMGRRRPPDRAPVLLNCFREVVGEVSSDRPVFIGGKSMGGRIASMLLNELSSSGAVLAGLCFGYPFHPFGQPSRVRTEHLEQLKAPLLILQGERDPMGCAEEVSRYDLKPPLQLQWIPDGDHSFKPRKRSGRTEEMNCDLAVELADQFMRAVLA